jgi:hypothetical protein
MPITIRRAEAADTAQCGIILYTAFQRLADDHNFARDFPSVDMAETWEMLARGRAKQRAKEQARHAKNSK